MKTITDCIHLLNQLSPEQLRIAYYTLLAIREGVADDAKK